MGGQITIEKTIGGELFQVPGNLTLENLVDRNIIIVALSEVLINEESDYDDNTFINVAIVPFEPLKKDGEQIEYEKQIELSLYGNVKNQIVQRTQEKVITTDDAGIVNSGLFLCSIGTFETRYKTNGYTIQKPILAGE